VSVFGGVRAHTPQDGKRLSKLVIGGLSANKRFWLSQQKEGKLGASKSKEG
jgi:hypothetical protein